MKRKTPGMLNLQQVKTSRYAGGGAEPICWCGDRRLSAVMKWLQLGNAPSMLIKVNIKLPIIVIA